MELETPGPRPPHPAHWGLLALREYLSLVLSRVSRLPSLVAEINFMSHLSVSILVQKSPPHFFLIIGFLA